MSLTHIVENESRKMGLGQKVALFSGAAILTVLGYACGGSNSSEPTQNSLNTPVATAKPTPAASSYSATPVPTAEPTQSPTPIKYANEVDPATLGPSDLTYLTSCESGVEPIVDPAQGPATLYSGLPVGTDILFPAESGTLTSSNLNPINDNFIYTLNSGGAVQFFAASGILNPNMTTVSRGEIIGQVVEGILGGQLASQNLQLYMVYLQDPVAGMISSPEFTGCLNK
ncbi:MAG: hypothetical protein AABX51_03030 [Nanoarchaeota archaeon]